MAKPNNFDGFCWFVVTNYDFVILKKLNLTAPFKKKHFLLHPQLDPILKFYCYFNSLVLPNMMRWTWFDLLIISGVKFWWFSFFYFLERTSGSQVMPNLRLVKNWEICWKIVIIIIGIMQYTVVHWTSFSFLTNLKLGITRLLEVQSRK